MTKHPELVRGLDIVELGSGPGLAGFVASLVGAQNTTLTDMEEYSLQVLEDSRGLNEKALNVCVQPLLWGSAESAQTLLGTRQGELFQACIATDVIYEPEAVFQLLHTASLIVQPGGKVYLSNHKYRYDKLHEAVEEASVLYDVRVLETSRLGEGEIDYFVFEIGKKKEEVKEGVEGEGEEQDGEQGVEEVVEGGQDKVVVEDQ